MKRLALVIAIAVPAVAAADTDALKTLFPFRAPIEADGTGLTRLELPTEVIRGCRPDLADLRIVAADGTEIPYVVDNPAPPGVATRVRYGVSPEVVDATRSREVADRVDIHRESFVLEVPPVPPDVPAWELVFDIASREFVARLDVAAIDTNGARTTVVTGGAVFRLPSSGAEKLRIALPTTRVARLEVRLESQDLGFLEPRFELEASRFLSGAGPTAVGLAVVDIREHAGSTEVVIERPRGVVPQRLDIATATDTFHRPVTVWDEGPGADPGPLGSEVVLRIAAIAPVEALAIPLRPPRGDRLRLVIEDGDSPPLERIAVTAKIPGPVLVFSMPGQAASLFFGGGRAHRPHYDLASLDPDLRVPSAGAEARTGLAVIDPSRGHIATSGRPEPNPSYDPAPVLAFAIHPGAELDARPYSHVRRLEVRPSAEGLARLRLSPADLAVARPDLADLRIVDAEGRQWAYLRQDAASSIALPMEVAEHEVDDRVSIYTIELDGGPLTLHRIDLEVGAPYLDRDYRLTGALPDGRERVLARGRLVRRAGDPRPVTVGVPPTRVTGLRLEVTDGDDAPLGIGRLEFHTTVPDLYMAADPGAYRLLLGNPDDRPPVYELERVRPAILAVPAAEIDAGELEPSPDFSASSRISGSAATQKVLLWVVLGVAVVVLFTITLRAARQEGAG